MTINQFAKILLSSLICSIAVGYDSVNDFDTAIEIAKIEKKQVLLIFTIDQCVYCDLLKSNLSKYNSINDKYIICLIDSSKQKRLNIRNKIRTWPTSLIISPQDKNFIEKDRMIGFSELKYFEWLEKNSQRQEKNQVQPLTGR